MKLDLKTLEVQKLDNEEMRAMTGGEPVTTLALVVAILGVIAALCPIVLKAMDIGERAYYQNKAKI